MLNIQEIREMITLIDESSINDFTYKNAGMTVSIKKGNPTVISNVEEGPKRQINLEKTPPVGGTPSSSLKTTPDEEVQNTQIENEKDDNIIEIVSPMVGTFYRKPSPDSDNFVNIGDQVKEDSVVCIVEAMKLFNEIEAEQSGEIIEILANDGELVEYGQALFKVKIK